MDAELISLRLPLPPSVNHYWGTVFRGKRACVYVTKRGLAYRADVKQAVRERFGAVVPCRQMVGVSVVMTETTRYHMDGDNVWKCLLDALPHSGLFLSDAQIREHGMCYSGEVHKDGWLDVRVWKMPPTPLPDVITKRIAKEMAKALLPPKPKAPPRKKATRKTKV